MELTDEQWMILEPLIPAKEQKNMGKDFEVRAIIIEEISTSHQLQRI